MVIIFILLLLCSVYFYIKANEANIKNRSLDKIIGLFLVYCIFLILSGIAFLLIIL